MNWLANSISMKKVSLFLLMGLHLDCWETGSGTQRERMSFLPSVQSRISATRSKHSSQESCNQMRWTLPHICYWSVDDFRQIGQCLWLSLLSETLLVNCEFPGAPWMKVYQFNISRRGHSKVPVSRRPSLICLLVTFLKHFKRFKKNILRMTKKE